MTQSKGKSERIAFGKEATYGTAVATNQEIGKNVVVTPNDSIAVNEILSDSSNNLDVKNITKGNQLYTFTLDFVATNFWFVKYGMFGTSSDPVSNVYTLTSSTTLPSFTLQRTRYFGGSSKTDTYTGCVIKSFTITINNTAGTTDGFISVSCECLAKDRTQTDTAPGGSITKYNVIKRDGSTVDILGEGNNKEVNNLTLTFDNSINDEDGFSVSSFIRQVQPLPNTKRYTMVANVTDTKDRFNDVKADVIDNQMTIKVGADTNNYVEFVADANKYSLTGANTNTNLEGLNITDLGLTILSFSSVKVKSHQLNGTDFVNYKMI